MDRLTRTVSLLALAAPLGCSAPDSPIQLPTAQPSAQPGSAEALENGARSGNDGPRDQEARPADGHPTKASTPAAVTPTIASPAEKRRYVVAAMGDSLTDPKSHGGKYLEYLADKCPRSRFDSYGIGGHMVNQMRRRFLHDVFGEGEDGKPIDGERPTYTHVIVLGGINDIISDETALRTNDQIKEDLAFMYEAARQRGAAVIALTLPPWGGFEKWYNPRRGASTHEINRWIKQQHRLGQVALLLDVYPLMSCGDPEFLCPKYGWPDQVHWSAAGHEAVGRALHEHLFSDCL